MLTHTEHVVSSDNTPVSPHLHHNKQTNSLIQVRLIKEVNYSLTGVQSIFRRLSNLCPKNIFQFTKKCSYNELKVF